MIALIAHDQKKADMLEFVRAHVDFFRQQQLVATGNTGKLLSEQLGLTIERVTHGPFGGDLIIGGRVAEGLVQAVLFFRDPLTAQPHEPDVSAFATCIRFRWRRIARPPKPLSVRFKWSRFETGCRAGMTRMTDAVSRRSTGGSPVCSPLNSQASRLCYVLLSDAN